jgi:Na+/serine symporter
MTTMTAAAPAARKPLYTSLLVQVLTALLLGIVLGMAVPDFAVGLKILSDAFLQLISMIVAPIVFCVVVHGIAGAGLALQGRVKKVQFSFIRDSIFKQRPSTQFVISGHRRPKDGVASAHICRQSISFRKCSFED